MKAAGFGRKPGATACSERFAATAVITRHAGKPKRLYPKARTDVSVFRTVPDLTTVLCCATIPSDFAKSPSFSRRDHSLHGWDQRVRGPSTRHPVDEQGQREQRSRLARVSPGRVSSSVQTVLFAFGIKRSYTTYTNHKIISNVN